jgi:hypothetical protein
MNHDYDDHIPPFDDAAREREWLAQEQAMRRERLHLDPAQDDPRMRRYRLLARALREPLPDTLPADFARQVAARTNARPLRQSPGDTRLELLPMVVLGIILVLAAGVVTLIYGNTWLPSIRAALPAPGWSATRWLLAFAGCIGVSWLLGTWQQRGHGR